MKITSFFPAIILTAVIFSSCSKKDDKSSLFPENNTKPEISFTYSGANEFAPAAVSFANATLNASSYKWNFGDNYTSTEGNPVHIYAAGGTYTVKLVATGQAGSDSSTQTLTILDAPTILKITSVTLTEFSFVNSSGVNWDIPGGPDVYFKITNSDSLVFYDGISLLEDSNVTQSDLPLTWNLPSPFTISDFSAYKAIRIYDYDSLDPHDYIGKAGFTPAMHATAQEHYPDSLEINTNDVFITLSLKWQ
ncbi:MAG TPA: PKD domain-containing protein [Bacteroidia bacterium]|nr:PKD domain-containing protein [Bacteroidia bacterium]